MGLRRTLDILYQHEDAGEQMAGAVGDAVPLLLASRYVSVDETAELGPAIVRVAPAFSRPNAGPMKGDANRPAMTKEPRCAQLSRSLSRSPSLLS